MSTVCSRSNPLMMGPLAKAKNGKLITAFHIQHTEKLAGIEQLGSLSANQNEQPCNELDRIVHIAYFIRK